MCVTLNVRPHMATEFLDFGRLAENEKAAASHAIDFDVPIYNVWKQQTKSKGAEHFGREIFSLLRTWSIKNAPCGAPCLIAARSWFADQSLSSARCSQDCRSAAGTAIASAWCLKVNLSRRRDNSIFPATHA
jgi:hypothetical protein